MNFVEQSNFHAMIVCVTVVLIHLTFTQHILRIIRSRDLGL